MNFSCDWPGCRPSAVSNDIVIVGPSLDSVSQASHAPITTARMGMIQMMGNRRERRIIARAGAGGSAMSLMA